jgi:hypothetical protein
MTDIDGPADGGLSRRRALRMLGLAASAAYLVPAALTISEAEGQPRTRRRTYRRTRPRRTYRRRTVRVRTFRPRTDRRRTDQRPRTRRY